MDIRTQLLNLIAAGFYVFTRHALDGMDRDQLEEEDVFHAIGNGKLTRRGEVCSTQGPALSGKLIYVACRIEKDQSGKEVVIISAHDAGK